MYRTRLSKATWEVKQGGTTSPHDSSLTARDFFIKVWHLLTRFPMLLDVRKTPYDAEDFVAAVAGVDMPYATLDSKVQKVNGVPRPLDAQTLEDLASFELTYKHELAVLVSSLKTAKVRKLILEGGHIYGDEEPGEKHFSDMKLTGLLRAHLLQQGFDVESLLMVDDFHPAENTLDVDAYKAAALAVGWPIDHLAFESEMAPLAEAMIETLRKLGKVAAQGDGLVLNDGRMSAHLLTPEKGELSCAILDSALSVIKYRILKGQGVVNVLDRGLKGQQRNTRQIVRAVLGEKRLPFFNFFIHPDSANVSSGAPHFFR